MARPADPKPTLTRGYWKVRFDGRDAHLGKDKRAAFAKFHRLMADRLSRDASPGRPDTVAGAIEVWLLSRKGAKYIHELRPFVKFAGQLHLDEVTPDLLHNYYDHIRNATYRRATKGGKLGKPKPYAISTIRDRVKRAQSVMRLAANRKWCDMPDVPKCAKPHFVNRSIDPVTLWNKLDALPQPARHIFKFIAGTGCRPQDAATLKWDEVHFDHDVCVKTDHKTADATGEPRIIALSDEALGALRSAPRTESEFVFLSRLGKPYTVQGLRSIAVRYSGRTTYDLRHSLAQKALDDGNDAATVSALLGHKSSGMVWNYAKIRDRKLVEAAKNLKLRRA